MHPCCKVLVLAVLLATLAGFTLSERDSVLDTSLYATLSGATPAQPSPSSFPLPPEIAPSEDSDCLDSVWKRMGTDCAQLRTDPDTKRAFVYEMLSCHVQGMHKPPLRCQSGNIKECLGQLPGELSTQFTMLLTHAEHMCMQVASGAFSRMTASLIDELRQESSVASSKLHDLSVNSDKIKDYLSEAQENSERLRARGEELHRELAQLRRSETAHHQSVRASLHSLGDRADESLQRLETSLQVQQKMHNNQDKILEGQDRARDQLSGIASQSSDIQKDLQATRGTVDEVLRTSSALQEGVALSVRLQHTLGEKQSEFAAQQQSLQDQVGGISKQGDHIQETLLSTQKTVDEVKNLEEATLEQVRTLHERQIRALQMAKESLEAQDNLKEGQQDMMSLQKSLHEESRKALVDITESSADILRKLQENHEALLRAHSEAKERLRLLRESQEQSFEVAQTKLGDLERQAVGTAESLNKHHEEMKESSNSILSLIRNIKRVVDVVLGEFHDFKSIFLYLGAMALVLLLTTSKSLHACRIPLLFVCVLSYAAERQAAELFHDSDPLTVLSTFWIVRKVAAAVALLVVAYRLYSYKSMSKQNNELLAKISESQSSLQRTLSDLQQASASSRFSSLAPGSISVSDDADAATRGNTPGEPFISSATPSHYPTTFTPGYSASGPAGVIQTPSWRLHSPAMDENRSSHPSRAGGDSDDGEEEEEEIEDPREVILCNSRSMTGQVRRRPHVLAKRPHSQVAGHEEEGEEEEEGGDGEGVLQMEVEEETGRWRAGHESTPDTPTKRTRHALSTPSSAAAQRSGRGKSTTRSSSRSRRRMEVDPVPLDNEVMEQDGQGATPRRMMTRSRSRSRSVSRK